MAKLYAKQLRKVEKSLATMRNIKKRHILLTFSLRTDVVSRLFSRDGTTFRASLTVFHHVLKLLTPFPAPPDLLPYQLSIKMKNFALVCTILSLTRVTSSALKPLTQRNSVRLDSTHRRRNVVMLLDPTSPVGSDSFSTTLPSTSSALTAVSASAEDMLVVASKPSSNTPSNSNTPDSQYELSPQQFVYVCLTCVFVTCLIIADVIGVKLFEIPLPFPIMGQSLPSLSLHCNKFI